MKRKRACYGIQMSDVLKEQDICKLFKIFSVNNDPSVDDFPFTHFSGSDSDQIVSSFDSDELNQCFSTAGLRPHTGPWHQLYRAARICHFSFLSIFHEQIFYSIKRPLGRPRRRWEDNIKMDLQEVGGSCGDWMELAQDRDRWRALVSTVTNFRVPKMRGNSWLVAEPVSFSRRTLLHGVSKYKLYIIYI